MISTLLSGIESLNISSSTFRIQAPLNRGLFKKGEFSWKISVEELAKAKHIKNKNKIII